MKWYDRFLLAPEGGEGAVGGGGDSGGDGGSSGDSGGTSLLDSDSGSQGEGDAGGHETKPYYLGLYGEDGKINKDHLDRLPEHLKDSKGLFERYDSIDTLLGGMRNFSQLAGKKGLEPLPEGATDEMKAERAELMGKLNNTPESPDGYNFTKPEDYPESIPWNDERTGKYAEILHRHKASPELAKELFNAQVEDARAEALGVDGKTNELFAAEQTKLKEEFGAKLPEVIDLAVRGLNTMAIKDGDNPVDKNHPIFRNAVAVKMAAEYARAISEDKLVSGDADPTRGMSDRAKALDILNNPNNPLHAAYHYAEHPQHEHAVKTRSELNRRYHAQQAS